MHPGHAISADRRATNTQAAGARSRHHLRTSLSTPCSQGRAGSVDLTMLEPQRGPAARPDDRPVESRDAESQLSDRAGRDPSPRPARTLVGGAARGPCLACRARPTRTRADPAGTPARSCAGRCCRDGSIELEAEPLDDRRPARDLVVDEVPRLFPAWDASLRLKTRCCQAVAGNGASPMTTCVACATLPPLAGGVRAGAEQADEVARSSAAGPARRPSECQAQPRADWARVTARMRSLPVRWSRRPAR